MNRMRLVWQLERVGWRYRQLRLWRLLAVVWLVAAALGAAFWGLRPPQANPLPLLCFVAVFGALSALYFTFRFARDPFWVARRVETMFPELQTCLLAALELKPDLPDGRFGYLQGCVIHQALSHARTHRWPDMISTAQLRLAALSNVFCFALFAVTLCLLAFMPPFQVQGGASLIPSVIKSGKTTMTVEPGNTEVELGSSLLVLARVEGPLPSEAMLTFQSASGEQTQLPMSANLNDQVFGGRIPVVDQPLEYSVALPDQTSPKYRVTVFEYPRLERADAQLVYPAYTKQENRVVQDVRTVSLVDGTTLTLQCFLNKSVVSAKLVDAKDAGAEPIALVSGEDEPLRYEATWTCLRSRRLKLELRDEAGRPNQKSIQFNINVLPNQPPSLKPVFPAKDLEVSPLEELDVKSSVWDDFGATKLGLTYSIGEHDPVDVTVAEQIAAKQKYEAMHVVRLEELSAAPDQLLSYHWWVEDIGPDGQPRRVLGDMYFAEVRPFEEIFRQGEQPPGGEQQQQQQNQQGQGQNAQAAQQLAKLQKDIINATWKLVRREVADPLSAGFATDAEQIQLSQETALEQASSLAERVQDDKSLEHIDAVLQQMQTAGDQLKQAAQTPSREPLRPALAAAQQAYQSLLKLRAREHEVVRQQQQQRGQQSSSQQQDSARSQQQRQQLQQLDLQSDENRYETERAAQERQQESAAERENRQVQNRLRELARRQSDVNERLKELQAALEEARSEEQKEEIRRQLKRLQDEQREILQDTDELQSRLEQPENAERMSEERQQLEETRDQVRKASEALEEQRVGQASAAGTRAEQQFEDLREEFRRRAANRFNDQMQEMRQAARELEQREQKIAKELAGEPTEPEESPPMLRDDTTDRDKLAEEVGQQRQRLDELQEQMRSTIGEAETSEPILSQRLYEAVRDAQDRQIQRSLQQTERAVRQGLTEQAQQQESAAGEGVRQLRESVERAAEGVLGDETEALRRAREELQNLSRELNDEIRRNGGQQPQGEADRPQGENETQRGQPGQQSGQSNPRDANPMQRGQGERGQGENSQGERGQAENGQDQNERGQRREPGNQNRDPANERANSSERGQREPDGQQRPRPGQPGNESPMQTGEQPGQTPQPGERQPGQQQPGSGQGQRGQPSAASRQQQDGQRGPRPVEQRPPRDGSPRGLNDNETGTTGGGGNQRMNAPLTGEAFRQWSDRLRDVEEMVEDPDLRAEAARIRERARAIRADFKRHSKEPNWDLVQQQVAGPLFELQDRVAEELLRRTSKKALIPLDRDPVPPQYSEKTRRYYEQLGTGK